MALADAVADEAGIPVLSSAGPPLTAEHLFELFHETTAPLFDAGPVGDVTGFHAAATDYLVDDLVVSRLRHGAHTLRRSAERVRAGDSNWITLQMYMRGGIRGQVAETVPLRLDAAHIGILDLAHPFSAWSTPVDVIWVGFPRDRLAAAPLLAATPQAPSWRLDSLEGRVLAAAVADLWRRLPSARADQAGELADAINETVDRVLSPHEAACDDASLLVAVKEHIATDLDDLHLDVDALRAAFHCSRSTLYRLFEEEGGIAGYIREQRLLRCFDELSRPARRFGRVSEIATRWGFENPSHFHRLFTRAFGLSPSELGHARPSTAEPARVTRDMQTQLEQFREWSITG